MMPLWSDYLGPKKAQVMKAHRLHHMESSNRLPPPRLCTPDGRSYYILQYGLASLFVFLLSFMFLKESSLETSIEVAYSPLFQHQQRSVEEQDWIRLPLSLFFC